MIEVVKSFATLVSRKETAENCLMHFSLPHKVYFLYLLIYFFFLLMPANYNKIVAVSFQKEKRGKKV